MLRGACFRLKLTMNDGRRCLFVSGSISCHTEVKNPFRKEQGNHVKSIAIFMGNHGSQRTEVDPTLPEINSLGFR
jgi:hypothetical protein